ncbi:uncharacterized protein LOC111038206 [Myzus persicae]|uniref:uncharacterized protein LOC111038206 n=1 Tax=Myzus persicae TaxID=13164 RepID=UPI000B93935E|nr:uncharacterized protein LOC111038206 [Myzus persicae]
MTFIPSLQCTLTINRPFYHRRLSEASYQHDLFQNLKFRPTSKDMKNMLTMWMKSNSINRCGNGLQVFFNCGIEQDTGYLKIAMSSILILSVKQLKNIMSSCCLKVFIWKNAAISIKS